MDSQPASGPTVTRPTAIVVGGGLAGLAAATRLAALGVRPILFEKRPFLGGRAYSFPDRRTGEEIDNGQHVLLGACTGYIRFLKEIGAWNSVHLCRGLDVPVLLNGRMSRLRSARLPGGLGMMAALLGYGHLSWAEKARIVFGIARAALERRDRNARLERMSFDKWLRWNGQTERTIDRFWDLVARAALNDVSRWVSADAGLMLVHTALLGSPSNAAIGWSRVGLTRLAGDAARSRIEALGGEVRTGVEVGRVEMAGDAVSGVRLTDGTAAASDACILAVPFHALAYLLPPDLAESEAFSPAASLETSPIVAVHIWYDRPVLEENFVAVLDSPVQWVFNVSSLHGEDPADGQHIVISLSGAWEWRDVPKAELRETFAAEMARLFPAATRDSATRVLVVKNLDATFRSAPGAARARLPQRTPVPGLFLAGDWTSTGWPSTMESAVRSGYLAADAALESLTSPRPPVGGTYTDD